MKIYLVTDGEYSDFLVRGAFSSVEKAEWAKVLFDTRNSILEFELDAIPETPPGTSGLLLYGVNMRRNGDEVQAYREPIGNYPQGHRFDQNYFYAHVYARDEEHAIKIANEKRIMELAR